MPMASTQAAPMPMGMPARGGLAPAASPMKPSLAMRRRAMMAGARPAMPVAGMNPNMMKKGGKADKHEDAAQDRAMIKKAMAGKKFASGGEIDSAETKTTIKGNAKKFEKTKVVDGDKHDKHSGTKGIKEGRPAGYASGGAIPADSDKKVNKGTTKMGGTIEGNEKSYVNTEMHQAKRDKAHNTGGIKERNAGGFKRGGKVPGIGRAIEHDGDWENRPADGTPKGKMNGTTGGVRESNAGGYKHGGHAAKKHYATGGDVDMGQADRSLRQSFRGDKKLPDMRALTKAAKAMGYESYMDVPDSRVKEFHELKKKHGYAKGGNVVDDGKAEKMPRHFVSKPVANSLQSGTFKKGGNVKRFKDGDPVIASETARMEAEKKAEREENEGMRNTILGAPGRAFNAVKSLFGSEPKPAGSVTKTKESVTVQPRKRGGSAKC